MRFKIDENLPDDVAELLVGDGYDAHTVHREGLSGVDDKILAQHACDEARIIVTLDLDFADIRVFPPTAHAGLIVLRLKDQSRSHVVNVMARLLAVLKRQPVAGQIWIVSEASVRIRGG